MKQKLGLACALVHTPKVLFLDEPTNGVDPVSRRDFWRILYQLLKEGTAIFVSTAYLDEADRCNRVGLIHKGKLLACAPPKDLKKLMQGIILEVRTGEPRRTARLLKDLLGEANVTQFGDKTHVAAGEFDRASALIRETCERKVFRPVEIREIDPSLEDVFVSVLTEKNRLDGSGINMIKDTARPDREEDYSVTLKDLKRRFGDFVAVNRVNLAVKKGEIFGFLGPNGAGKSTTIRMLCGILTPSGGSGQWRASTSSATRRGSRTYRLHEPEFFPLRRPHRGGKHRLLQRHLQDPSEENGSGRSGCSAWPALRSTASTRTAVLSGGWKQRLALGCAILHEPPIIFLDEPTSGVDPISRRNFWDLIYHLADQGVTVFVTTHYMDEAEYCDRLGLIYRGELIAMGTPGELKSGFMSEEVVEMACDRPNEALGYVEELSGIRNAALFGRGLHVVTENAAQCNTRHKRNINRQGYSI